MQDMEVVGGNATVVVSDSTRHGTISEFRDGDTDLGFEVTLSTNFW